MSNKYAIIENSMVVNTVLAEDDYANEQGWIKIVDDRVCIGWSYTNGSFIEPPITIDVETIKQINKLEAERLLFNSDWVEYPSVTDQTKNPHLNNLNEWIDYRVALRAIAVNPPDYRIVEWPVSPVSQWGSSN